MTRQTTPHTQSQQNGSSEQTDLPDELSSEAGLANDEAYANMEGAETGSNRSPRQTERGWKQHNTEPPEAAYEGSVTTRTPREAKQGITSRSADEESERQEKVIRDRPDARAGVNHSGKNVA